MNVDINNAIGLVTTAIQQQTDQAANKAAYKKVKEICYRVLSSHFAPGENVISDLDKLLRLDAQLPKIEGKYYDKLQCCLDKIMRRKANWAAHAHMTASCKKILCGATQEPVVLPGNAFDLLKTHSAFIRENLENQSEITLSSIPKRTLLQILEQLSGGSLPNLSEYELNNFYMAVDFLGIQSLGQQAYIAIKEQLSKQSYDEILKTLCKISIGKISGTRLAQAALEVFIEQECCYARNVEYLIQPDPQAHIECYVCPKYKITFEEFRQQASQHCPGFLQYLDALQTVSTGTQSTIVRLAEGVQALRKSAASVLTLGFEPVTDEAFLTASIFLMSNIGANKLAGISLTSIQKAIINPRDAPDDLLINNPVSWGVKMLFCYRATHTPKQMEELAEAIIQYQQQVKGETKQAFSFLCHGLLFSLYARLDKAKLAKEQIPFVNRETLQMLGSLDHYYYYLYETGCFSNPHHSDLLRLYQGNFMPGQIQKQNYKKLAEVTFGKTFPGETILPVGFRSSQIDLGHPIESLIVLCQENPELALPRIILAQYFWKHNQNQSAIHYCSAVLRLQNNPAMLYLRARLLLAEKAYGRAEQDCLELLRHDFSFVNASLYTRCLSEAYGFESARDYLEKLNSWEDLTNYLKVDLLISANKLEKADEILRSMRRYCLNQPRFLLLQGMLLAKYPNKMDEANKAFFAGLNADQNNPQFLEQIMASVEHAHFPTKLDLAILQPVMHRLKNHPAWQEPPEYAPFLIWEALKNFFEGKPVGDHPATARIALFEALYKDPIEAKAEVNTLQPRLPDYYKSLSACMLAHRLEDYDRVIAEISLDVSDPFLRVLLADAYRKKGDFNTAKTLLGILSTPYACLVTIAMELDQPGSPKALETLEDDKKQLLEIIKNDFLYQPFIELAYQNLIKMGFVEYKAELRVKYLKSSESARLFFAGIPQGYHYIIALQKRGYTGEHWDIVLHDDLTAHGKYALMNEAFLASHLQYKAAYGDYLFNFNRFQEALPHLSSKIKIGECYEHLKQYKEAIAAYEESQDPAACQRASILKARLEGTLPPTHFDFAFFGRGLVPEVRKLFEEGRYDAIIALAERPNGDPYHMWSPDIVLMLAQSYHLHGKSKKAKEVVETIKCYYDRDIYGPGPWEEIQHWAELHIPAKQRKKAKK